MLVIRFLFLLIFAIFTGHTLAQVQQGIIKTLGRPEKKGNIGSLCIKQEQYDEAIINYQCALKILRTFHGECHPQIAVVLHNIGKVYGKQDDYTNSLLYEKQALDINEKVYGKNHNETAESMRDVANIYFLAEDYEQARSYYTEAMDEAHSCSSYQIEAQCYEGLANIFMSSEKAEDLKAAPEYFLQGAECYKKTENVDETKVNTCLVRATTAYLLLGKNYYTKEQYDDAIKTLCKLLDFINSRKCNERSCVEFKVRCLYYLGLSYTAKSDSPKSLGCFKQAVEIGTPVLGPDDESIKECLSIIESLQNEISK